MSGNQRQKPQTTIDTNQLRHLRSVPTGEDAGKPERKRLSPWAGGALAIAAALGGAAAIANQGGGDSPESKPNPTIRGGHTLFVPEGADAWSLAAERTDKGKDAQPLVDEIKRQAEQDGRPGLQAYNPADGTGDVLDLPAVVPRSEDANPLNDPPEPAPTVE